MTDELTTLTPEQLSRTTGGFLPLLLGLIGPAMGLAGQITGAIGQSKSKEAEQLNAQTQGQAGSPGAAAPAGAGNVMAQPQPQAQSSGGG